MLHRTFLVWEAEDGTGEVYYCPFYDYYLAYVFSATIGKPIPLGRWATRSRAIAKIQETVNVG